MMFVADGFLTEAYADEEAVAILCSEHCARLKLPSSDALVRRILNLFRLILIFYLVRAEDGEWRNIYLILNGVFLTLIIAI
jgi:hypothetical protein